MKRFTRAALAPATTCAIAALAFAQEKVTVWFTKGFCKAEDDALYEVVKKYETKNLCHRIHSGFLKNGVCNSYTQ